MMKSIKPKLFILDLDGTLYDLRDVERMSYEMQVEFLMLKKKCSHLEAMDFLNTHSIYLEKKHNSKSATELFSRLGIDLEEWSSYRNQHFDVSKIDKSKAVKEIDLLELKDECHIVLLSSNSMILIEKILLLLDINQTFFTEIICSDSGYFQPEFNKKEAMKLISRKYKIPFKEIVSIGDRYQTDISPILELGGKGLLVAGPQGLITIVNDYKACSLGDCDSYSTYGF